MRISDWSSDVCSPIFRALVGGGRELAFGEAVHAVVHDDVDHVHAPPHDVGELAEADRGAVAIAGDAEIDQLAVGEVGAGQHARHAAVHGVEAVRSEEHTSELQSLMRISYAVFCLKKKKHPDTR